MRRIRWLLVLLGGLLTVLVVLTLIAPFFDSLSTSNADLTCADIFTQIQSETFTPTDLTTFLPDDFDQSSYALISAGNAALLEPLETITVDAAEIPYSRSIGRWAYSPDESLLIYLQGVPSYATEVYMCDTATQEEQNHIRTDERTSQVAFLPDGSAFLIHEGQGRISIYDSVTLRRKSRISIDGISVSNYLAISPDGTAVAFTASERDAKGYSVFVYAIQSRRELAKLTGHEDVVTSVMFNDEGNLLFSASGRESAVRVWGIP